MDKKLYRAKEGKMIGGVCAGIGSYFNIDPTIVRLGAVIFAFIGAGVVAYVVAMLIVPVEPD